jgi:hypothetical protein
MPGLPPILPGFSASGDRVVYLDLQQVLSQDQSTALQFSKRSHRSTCKGAVTHHSGMRSSAQSLCSLGQGAAPASSLRAELAVNLDCCATLRKQLATIVVIVVVGVLAVYQEAAAGDRRQQTAAATAIVVVIVVVV